MCIYPRFIQNPRYKSNKKNGGYKPICTDDAKATVPIGCGNCIECRRQKAQEWRVRMHEEIKENPNAYFVTLSFSPQSIEKLSKDYEINLVNDLATKATRLYLERWRKKYKKSVRHWLITELGQTRTERIHMHGIIWCSQEQIKDITEKWQYGNTWIGNYCNQRTVNYIIKYVTKIDEKHKDFKPKILCSRGIGAAFIDKGAKIYHSYKPHNTAEWYALPNGAKVNLPIYYRNKLYSEEERDNLWTERIEKHIIYCMGNKFDISNADGIANYMKFIKIKQQDNEDLGYGTDKWKPKDYEITLQMLNTNTRTR